MNTATALVLIGLTVIGLWALKSYLRKLESGCCGAKVKKKEAADIEIRHDPHHLTLRVEGMACGSCARRVENALNASAERSGKPASARAIRPERTANQGGSAAGGFKRSCDIL